MIMSAARILMAVENLDVWLIRRMFAHPQPSFFFRLHSALTSVLAGPRASVVGVWRYQGIAGITPAPILKKGDFS